MGRTKINWTEHSWPVVVGCDAVSAGCANCYAALMAARLEAIERARGEVGPYTGLATRQGNHAKWTGAVRLNEKVLTAPLRRRKPTRFFASPMGDLFHPAVTDAMLDRIFAVMALCPQHTFQVLTKRPDRMGEYIASTGTKLGRQYEIRQAIEDLTPFPADKFGSHIETCRAKTRVSGTFSERPPLPNVWLGTSIENQRTADERIPHLLATPAAVRFLSCEPLLGLPDIGWALPRNPIEIAAGFLSRGHFAPALETLRPLDWVIAGGESGPHARPMHPDWVRSLRDQCATTGVPFLFKQWGEWASAAFSGSTGEMVFRQFKTFDQWVNKASTWVKGGVGLDRTGAVLEIGGDVMKARDEGRFPVTIMNRVGKSAAGRLLDGIEHDASPEVRS
jgi:protein gp37